MTARYYLAFEDALIERVKTIGAADPAHDFAHIQRVVNIAKHLAEQEKANLDIVVPAAWLHDCVAVAKNSPLRSRASALAAEYAEAFLISINYNTELLEAIKHAIIAHSYSADVAPITLEAQVVQDADRMDALGAIGIARCMLVGGSIGRQLYCENDPLATTRAPDDLNYTIDHFFTKLLSIGDHMCTPSARVEAKRRTDYMKHYLTQLARDINGTDMMTPIHHLCSESLPN